MKDIMEGISPLPWAVDDWGREEYLDGALCRYGIKPNGKWSSAYIHRKQDAAYIVHTCNLYPELVQALHEIVYNGSLSHDDVIDIASVVLVKCKAGAE